DVTASDPYARALYQRQLSVQQFPAVSWSMLASNVAMSTGNLLFARELFDLIGSFTNLAYCHDWDFVLRSCVYSEPVLVPEQLYRYRLHNSNTFRSLTETAAFDVKRVRERYFATLSSERHRNCLAPASDDWPYLFSWFAGGLGL